jgi:hypothetical protein
MDLFLNNSAHNLSYNANAQFSQSERTYLNHPQASEVSVNMLCIQPG